MPESKLLPLTFRRHNPVQNFMYFVVHVMLQSSHTTSFHNSTANIIPSRWHDVMSIYLAFQPYVTDFDENLPVGAEHQN